MNEEEKDLYTSQIFAAIAHEIRNPLQGIMASAAALSCRIEDELSVQPYVEMINRETSRINLLIDDMLELTQSIQIDPKPQSINTILDDAIRNVNDVISQRSASVLTSITPKLPAVIADCHRLGRAFSAILQNAAESKDQGAIVELQTEKTAGSIIIKIKDNGNGISAGNLEKIFQPFFSTHRKRAGLGLCIAERVIRGHKGSIHVRSSQTDGTEIQIELPAAT